MGPENRRLSQLRCILPGRPPAGGGDEVAVIGSTKYRVESQQKDAPIFREPAVPGETAPGTAYT
jgi:hypothetical protein